MTWPPASTVCPAAPDSLPSSAILPSLTATSPIKDGMPEPSTIRPFLISRSYAIGTPPHVRYPPHATAVTDLTKRSVPAGHCGRELMAPLIVTFSRGEYYMFVWTFNDRRPWARPPPVR